MREKKLHGVKKKVQRHIYISFDIYIISVKEQPDGSAA